jgi:putative resolvase
MEHTYSPKQFGKLIGKSVNTLQKWDRKGILPAFRSPTNRRYYTHEQYLQYRGLISSEQGLVIAYARVSSPSQKKDLAIQKEALRAYCLEYGIKVDQWIEDIGSALNYPRIAQRDMHSIEVAPGDLSRWCVFCEEVVVPL